VELTVGHDVEELAQDAVVLADVWGGAGRTLPGVDTVVLATGRICRDALHDELVARRADVRIIGDARTPRTTTAVIHEAELCGRAL
jgi:hypothetical protein